MIGLNRYIDHCVSSLECTDSCALVVVCYSVYKACVKDYKDSVLDGNHSNPITARITNLTWTNLFVFSFLQNTMNSGVQGAWALYVISTSNINKNNHEKKWQILSFSSGLSSLQLGWCQLIMSFNRIHTQGVVSRNFPMPSESESPTIVGDKQKKYHRAYHFGHDNHTTAVKGR